MTDGRRSTIQLAIQAGAARGISVATHIIVSGPYLLEGQTEDPSKAAACQKLAQALDDAIRTVVRAHGLIDHHDLPPR